MITRAGHLPMRKNNGIDFAALIKHSEKHAKKIKKHSAEFLKSLPVTENENYYGEKIRSFFSWEMTLEKMIEFYDFVLLKRREDYCVRTGGNICADDGIGTDNNVRSGGTVSTGENIRTVVSTVESCTCAAEACVLALECPHIWNIDGDELSEASRCFEINDRDIQRLIDKHFTHNNAQ